MKDKSLTYRKAKPNDLEQLIDLTIQAFNGYNGRSLLESIFDVSKDDFRAIVKLLFEAEIPNNEFDINSYYVLEKDKELVSCLAGWKEGKEGIESERLLPSMFLKWVGAENWFTKKDIIERASSLNIPRESGKIQIENMFLKKEFRGTASFFKIYYKTVDQLFKENEDSSIVQSRFFRSNNKAIRIAKHIGYGIVKETSLDIEPINLIFPNEGLVMTELDREVFYSNNKTKSRLK
ncbi:MAG: hypothetical protein AAF487_13365 [Bacteroidota bacterium]